MKKMVMVLMTLMMAGSLFAYEPKKDCAKVKRNGDVKYYEKTDPYKSSPWKEEYKDYVKWVIREGYTVKDFVDYKYSILESSRERYYFSMEKATNPKPSGSGLVAFSILK